MEEDTCMSHEEEDTYHDPLYGRQVVPHILLRHLVAIFLNLIYIMILYI
jgi:hypothetical protein